MTDTLDISLTDADYALVLTALHTHEQLARRQLGSPDPQTADRWRLELATTQALADRFHHKRSEFSYSEDLLAVLCEPPEVTGEPHSLQAEEGKPCPDR